MSRRTAARFGKMPTTSVRRRISLLRRSWGLFDQTCVQCATGNAVKARTSGLFQHHGGLGEAFVEHAHHARMVGMDLFRGGLLIDRPDHGRHPRLCTPRDSGAGWS